MQPHIFRRTWCAFLALVLSVGLLVGIQVAAQAAVVVTNYEVGSNPYGVAVDATGNVYTANRSDDTVSRITPDGTVTKAWATIDDSPYSIAADSSGNVYTANRNDDTVSKIDPDGTVTDTWTVGDDPYGIAVDSSGNIYTANFFYGTISKIDPAGDVETNWVSIGAGAGLSSIAVDSSDNIFTAGGRDSTVSKIAPDGSVTDTWDVSSDPQSIAVDSSGNIFTASYPEGTISKITPTGVVTAEWAWAGMFPGALAADSSGNVFATVQADDTVTKIASDGVETYDWASIGTSSWGIAVDPSGTVYTANEYSDTVSKIVTTTTPSAPTISRITPGDRSLLVEFRTPGDTGGSAITNYQYSTDNGASWKMRKPISAKTPLKISGLTNGIKYRIRIRAVSATGDVGTASVAKIGSPASAIRTPGTPRRAKVSGSLRAMKYKVSWRKSEHSASRTKYTVRVYQPRSKRIILAKKTTRKLSTTFTRRHLVKAWRKSVQSRGEFRGVVSMRVAITAQTGAKSSKPATTRIRILV